MRTDPSEFIPTSDDTPEQWIEFHKALNKWFSKNESNSEWLRFWNQRAGAGSDADTHTLRAYMEDHGVDLTTNTEGELTDTVLGVSDWIGDTAKWIRGIVLGTVILIIALIAFYIYSQTKNGKSATDMALSMPVGRKKGLIELLA